MAILVRHKTGVIVQGFPELDTGDKSSAALLMESILAALAKAAWENMFIHWVDIEMVLLPWKRRPHDPDMFVFLPGGFDCTKQWTSQVRELMT